MSSILPLHTENPEFVLPGISIGVVTRAQRIESPGLFSLAAAGIGAKRETRLFRNVFAAHLGCRVEDICLVRQVHGDRIVPRSRSDAGGIRTGDAQWTADAGLALVVLVADCCPVVLVAPGQGLIGIAHAGWRGAVKEIVPALASTLKKAGATAETMHAWVGPCAEGDRYEVGPEVASQFERWSHALIAGSGSRYLLDIRTVVFSQLRGAGILPQHISVSRSGTIGDPRYHSYRRDRYASGRMAAYVMSSLDDER